MADAGGTSSKADVSMPHWPAAVRMTAHSAHHSQRSASSTMSMAAMHMDTTMAACGARRCMHNMAPQPHSPRAPRTRAAQEGPRAVHRQRTRVCLPQAARRRTACPSKAAPPAHLRLARHRGLAEVGVHDAHGDEVEEEVAPVQVCRRGGARKHS